MARLGSDLSSVVRSKMKAFTSLSFHPFQKLKRFMPRSLFGRAILILVIPVVVIQVITAIVFWERHWTKTTSTLALNIAGEITTVVYLANDMDDLAFFRLRTVSNSFLYKNVKRRVREEGFLIPSSKPNDWRANYLHRALKQVSNFPHRISISDDSISIEVLYQDYIYNFDVPRWNLLPKTIPIVLWWEIGAPLFFIFIALIFLKNQVRPLQRLASVVEDFGKGRDTTAYKPSGSYEVRRVGQSFNRMRDRIQTMITQRTEMLAGISHDLRTPLTRMRLQLTLADPSEERDALLGDVKEMMHMVEEYLAFARGEGTEKESQILGHDFFMDLFSRYKGQKVHILGLDGLIGITIRVRPNSLKRALKNVISNALNYGDELWVYISTTPRTLVLLFEDNGPGIPASRREDVFQPFVRLDASRNSETGGYGLGLSITKDVITSLGGSIYLGDSLKHGGLSVSIHLPL